jgi:hypothetical protein
MALPDVGVTTRLYLSQSQTQRTAQVSVCSFLLSTLDELRGKIHERVALATQAEKPVTAECEVR